MARLPRKPAFWLTAFIVWFVTLYILSSFAGPGGVAPIEGFDKVEHFGYFFGGSGLFCAWLFRRNPENPNWTALLVTAVLVLGLVGWLDEVHQGFTPGRSGNDPFDWIADFLGAVVGALVFKALHPRLK